MAPVTLNEPEVMAVRIIDIYRVQHPRCKVQHLSEMAKQCRMTFRNACMNLKWNSTMVHHSSAMGSRRRATVIPFYRKNPRVEKTKGKKLLRPVWDSDSLFWALNYPLTAESCQTVEFTESIVLTSYGSLNSKRARSYGLPNNRYLQGATSTVHGATSVRNGEIVPYDF